MAANQVTIVIPCYNYGDYVGEAIESALGQTTPCDVIVVDDGSTDNSSEVIRRYPVMLIRRENGGASAACNSGIDAARTEWVCLLSADDVLDTRMIKRCLAVDADIIGTDVRMFGDRSDEYGFITNPTFEDFLTSNRLNATSLFRKAMWVSIGGLDESMRLGYEDWDFWLRATKAGYTVRNLPEVLFYYRKHGESLTTAAIAHHFDLLEYMRAKHMESTT